MKEHVIVNEVGLRDGLQNQPRPVPTEKKLVLAEALLNAGVCHLEATSFVSPRAVPQLADAAELFGALPNRPGLNYTALVPNERGYERAVAAGARSVAVVVAATETLNAKNINMSLEQATATCESVLKRAKGDGIVTRAYIAAACACPFEGVTPSAAVLSLTERMLKADAGEIAIADTIGAGHPRQVADLFKSVVAVVEPSRVAAHFHDTRGMGVALAWVALEAGIRKFDSSIGGLGGCPFAPGATGNLATEDLVFLLMESGFETGIDLEKLVAAVGVAENVTGQALGGKIIPWWKGRGGDGAKGKTSLRAAS
jgi:hydroxymethylglutaryl-CoA lyase